MTMPDWVSPQQIVLALLQIAFGYLLGRYSRRRTSVHR